MRGAVVAAVVLPVISAPADTFRCEKYACTLTARACVIRQGAVARTGDWVGGGLRRPAVTSGKNTRETGKTPSSNDYCASGECAQGAAVKQQLNGVEVEPPRKVDFRVQFAAKRRQANPARLITAAREDPMPDQFLRRVAEQREREQNIDPLGDDARDAYLDTQLRLKCSYPGCERRPHDSRTAKSDRCAFHARPRFGGGEVTAERRTPPAPAAKASPPPIPTATATKEAEMANEKTTCSKCGKGLRADNAKGFCGDATACRERAGGIAKSPRAAPAKRATRGAADDVVALLQSQLDGCDRCTRLRRAIEALSGA